MAIIGDALRQAFMPKHEYESLREEDRAWGKLQRPLLTAFVAVICLVVVVSTIIAMEIVFPADPVRRPFCGDGPLLPLQINVRGGGGEGEGDSDLLPEAFYLTDQETVDYFWRVVFVPSIIIFLLTLIYLISGITVAYSAPTRHNCLKVVENNYCASKRAAPYCAFIPGLSMKCLGLLG